MVFFLLERDSSIKMMMNPPQQAKCNNPKCNTSIFEI